MTDISRQEYYKNIDLRFEIIHQLKHRETMFIPFDSNNNAKPPIRWLNASCLKFLDKHFERYGFLDEKMNIYNSLATYKDFPMFSYNWRIKSQEQEIWLKEFIHHIEKYDCFIETDCKKIDIAKSDILKVKKFLDEHKVRYSIKFSGSKGFHIIIEYDDFSFIPLPIFVDDESKPDYVKLFKLINLRLKTMLGADTIDTSISDIKRVCKTAYTWDVKSGLIAYPLTDAQLDNFSTVMVMPRNVIRYNNHKRGLLWRNHTCMTQRKMHILDMLKALAIDYDKTPEVLARIKEQT